MKPFVVCAGLLVLFSAASAQHSLDYSVTDHAFNAAAIPRHGTVLTSPAFQITFGSVGQPAGMVPIEASSYQVSGGFTATYRPPGEVLALRFIDGQTLEWAAEPAAGVYNLYRDVIDTIASLAYGVCEQPGLVSPTALESSVPPPGAGYFYLVTARNLLGEEGTKGSGSGISRPNPNPCP